MSKKTETIEIRVSPELKARIATLSQQEGTTMSGYLRSRLNSEGTTQTTGVPPMKRTTSLFGARAMIAALPVSMLAGVYLLSSGAAVTASQNLRATFVELDLNQDGVLTADEFAASYVLGGPDELDAEEGALPEVCAADFAAMTVSSDDAAALAQAELAEMDTNGDAKVSFAEMLASTQRERAEEFIEMDTDGNGLLSVEEVSAYFDAQSAPFEIATDTPEGENAEPDPMPLSDACLAALDAQWKDAVLLAGEDGLTAEAAMDASVEDGLNLWLAEMDMNDDGHVSLGEYIQH